MYVPSAFERTDPAELFAFIESHSFALLVSTREPETTEVRSFRIVDGAVTEEPVAVVNRDVDQHAVQSYLFGQSPTTVDYECSA